MIYPWHELIWSQLRADGVQQHHALLLHGQAGTGKRQFADMFAKSLLCLNLDERRFACGQCSDCRWFDQGVHPDFRLLTSKALQGEAEAEVVEEEEARTEKKLTTQITAEQVRDLQGFVSLTTHRAGSKRVVLIHPAAAMNVFAANALLKMLEEPPAQCVFLLVADEVRHLLPTIISRCRRVPLPSANRNQALVWLQEQGIADAEGLLAQAGGAPLAALSMADAGEQEKRRSFLDQLATLAGPGRALDLAAQFQKVALSTILRWLFTWCYDLMACRLTGTIRYHPDYHDAIKTIAIQLPMDELLVHQDLLKAAARSVNHPLNPRLFVEQLLLSYVDAVAGQHEQP